MIPEVTERPRYALLVDGTTIEIRPAAAADFDRVLRFHDEMSPDNLYLRFFGVSKAAGKREAERVCGPHDAERAALLALLDDDVVGVASYEATGDPGVAEVAFAVADQMHGRGIATLLLEHLVSLARARHLQAFTAQTLAENTGMLRVFTDAGLTVRRATAGGTVQLAMPLPRDAGLSEPSRYLDAVARRESRADVASLRPLLRPASVAVIGASRRPGTVGRSILHNVVTGGFAGRVYAVNPHADELEGVPCLPSVSALPEPPDLAVVAVPPAAVPGVARECGERGARGLVVITSALDGTQSAALIAACRRHGMRLVGPNCFGVAVPEIGLDATFAARHPVAGTAGVVMQSGGLGFSIVDHLSGLGIGVSSFASVGNKYDVSSNDMLEWWERDGVSRLAILYIESFGNPRKFARTARRVGQTIPVLTVYGGRSEVGQRAAASHTAAVATPLVSREALFEQAGVIATKAFGELIGTAALLASQPPPTGTRVAIISNVGGGGVLAADACADSGLVIHTSSARVQEELGRIVPPGGALGGPVDTTAALPPEDFGRCLEIVAADEGVNALLAVVLATGPNASLSDVIGSAAVGVPFAAVVLDQEEAVRLIPRAGGEKIPAYAYPESAARALGNAARYGSWRVRPRTVAQPLADARPDEARRLVDGFLTRMPGGGWLPPDEVARLLGCYRVPLVETRRALGADEAVAVAASLSGPVALKADVTGLVHKSDAGAVDLGLRGEADIRGAFGRFREKFGDSLTGVLVQPMITGGVEVIIGVVQESVFGPLVVFGLGGVATEVLGDHAARLAPLTDADADEMIRAIHAAPLLLGHRGTPAADLGALRDALLRVSRLADDLPQLVELDLNPVIARPDGVFAVDARIRVTARHQVDPFLRTLR